MIKEQKSELIALKLEPSLLKKIKLVADKEDTTVSAIIRRAIKKHIK